MTQPKLATTQVASMQASFLQHLPIDDRQDYRDATRGWLGGIEDAEYVNELGGVIWSLKPYAFLASNDIPDSVNPSLWRQAQLNMNHGLFEVVEGVYQIRGMDIANMTIVEGDTGIIVIDTLSCQEGAQAALELYRAHRGNRAVSAVILTHTHTDHWGGVLGVASAEDYASDKVPLIAPDEFMEHAVSENIMAGNAMRRRALFQFGPLLSVGEYGHVDNGLGKSFAMGTFALASPNDLITYTGEKRVIDGVNVVFQMAPDTEAPAEMHLFFPDLGVLNLAENAVHNFHNLLPFRGAKVRNAQNWSHYIGEALALWGNDISVLIGQHHWPVWGNDKATEYLSVQRDLYKYVHDQTLKMINNGYTADEIAETMKLPESIDKHWHARGYYGSLKHNVKAIYQHYLGWYDAVPAHLDALPPAQTGAKMLDYMGGIDKVLSRAQVDFAKGEFRWVAQVMNHAVFADPTHQEARQLLADTYEQLGYLAECATWRNSYLYAAHELRLGVPDRSISKAISLQTLAALTSAQIFDLLGSRVNAERAANKRIIIVFEFSDKGEIQRLNLDNSALTHRTCLASESLEPLHIQTTRVCFDRILLRELAVLEAIKSGELSFTGEISLLSELFALFDQPDPNFAVVEP